MFQFRILVVEDDPDVARTVAAVLEGAGHEVEVAGSLAEGRRSLDEISLVVLDRWLPDGDGLELLREIRASGRMTGVLVLSARDAVEDRLAGLRSGADDYLGKPFHAAELLARVEARARRAQGHPPPAAVADLRFEPGRGSFYRGATELILSTQEHNLLRYLFTHAGRVIPRMELLEEVWRMHHDPGTNVVDVYIRYLRRKVDEPFGQPLIHTVRGHGYVLEDRGAPP